MKKETTYQRIKREREEFRRQLMELVLNPDSNESNTIRMRVRVGAGIAKQIWAGTYTEA